MKKDTYKDILRQQLYEAEANRPCFDSFDDYVKVHPSGERYRRWVMDSIQYILFPCYQEGCGLPGHYYFAYIRREYRHGKWLGTYYVHVNDCDDFGCNKRGLTLDEAKAELENLKLLAPFTIHELADFGYTDF